MCLFGRLKDMRSFMTQTDQYAVVKLNRDCMDKRKNMTEDVRSALMGWELDFQNDSFIDFFFREKALQRINVH